MQTANTNIIPLEANKSLTHLKNAIRRIPFTDRLGIKKNDKKEKHDHQVPPG